MGEKPSRHMTATRPSKHLERANSLIDIIDRPTGLQGKEAIWRRDNWDWEVQGEGRREREGKPTMGEKPSRYMTATGPSKHLERANSLKSRYTTRD